MNSNGTKTKIIVALLSLMMSGIGYWVSKIDAKVDAVTGDMREVQADIRNISSGITDLKEWMRARSSRENSNWQTRGR